jgi:serine protease AprX
MPSSAIKADRDGDKLFQDLEQRLAGKSPTDRLSVIVMLDSAASAERVRGLERAVGTFQGTRRFSIIDGFAATMSKRQIEALAHEEGVKHIEENSTARALNDTAQQSFGVTKARIDAPNLDGDADGNAATYSKNDLVAAVIDTGIDTGHLDLDEGKVLAFKDFVNGRTTAYDDDGHGTHVSATLAGDGDARPDHLYKGVAPAAALVGVKVLNGRGSGTEAAVIAGIDWVAQNKATYGIEAINLSLGIAGCSDGTDGTSTAVDNAQAAGLVVAVAAGNEGPGTCTIGSPAAARKAITVGNMADFGPNGFYQDYQSSRGPTADGRVKPDVSSPGVSITSAQAGTTNGYIAFSGTSMATPFTAGVALLMLDQSPALTPQQVKDEIVGTAIDWARGGDNKTAGSVGPDIDYGTGRLDAYAALQSAGAPLNDPPVAATHELEEGTLSGTGAQIDYPLEITNTTFPIAATMIIPAVSGATSTNPDFDIYLLDSHGAELARGYTYLRQEQLGYKPTVTGTYTLRVKSYNGSGAYFVDVSTPPKSLPYSHPVGASPLRVSLVPAFQPCETPGNSVHGAPLDFASCSPPQRTSSAVAAGPGSLGFARMIVCDSGSSTPICGPVSKPDLKLTGSITDVRSGGPAGGDYDDPDGQPDLTETFRLRLTDNSSGSATVVDRPFSVPMDCIATPSNPNVGSTCTVNTTANALLPGVVVSGRAAVWQVGEIEVDDQGQDGVRGNGDDRRFEVQGYFLP